MQAKTRSAPRTPSLCRRSIQSADALRQLAQNVGPVADGGVFGARAADKVDAGGQGGRIAGAEAR